MAEVEVVPALGGIGHIDQYHGQFPDGSSLEGLTVRIFDPGSGQWSIHWSDNRVCRFLPPMVGAFRDGVGEFHGEDVCNGKSVRVVFHWSDITPTSARWDQSFSADNGQTWELNWEMFLTRLDERAS